MSTLAKLLLLCKLTTSSAADLYNNSLTDSKLNGISAFLFSVKRLFL